jgi:hypothetical protein
VYSDVEDLKAGGMGEELSVPKTGVIFGLQLLNCQYTWNQRDPPLVTGSDKIVAWPVKNKLSNGKDLEAQGFGAISPLNIRLPD